MSIFDLISIGLVSLKFKCGDKNLKNLRYYAI